MIAKRHQAIEAILVHFDYDHLRPDLREYAGKVRDLAYWMVDNLPDDPQLTIGLQDLLRAKDAFVRAAVVTRGR